MYSSELAVSNQVYARTGCGSINYYYEAVTVTVIETDYYTIISNSTIDIYVSLYKNKFDVFNPRVNLISEKDTSHCDQRFETLNRLQMDTTYILVMTTPYPNVTGAFSMLVTGPKNVSIDHIGEYY